jgi:uncharacterized protein (TIGR02217 family)
MVFVNIPFPDCLAFGAQSDPMWSTDLAAVLGGQEITNQNWEDTRHAFDVSYAIKTLTDYQLCRSHFHQIRGRAKKFLFRDFLDFDATSANGVLLDTSGAIPAADGNFQLTKRYGSGSDRYDRKITRPDTPVQVLRTRGVTTTNIVGSGATVTYTTGVVAITGHVGGDTYAWSGTFMVPCRYDTDRLPAAAVNRGDELLVQCGPIPIVEVRE